MKTVISLIPNDEHLVEAKKELTKAGFGESKTSILFQPADVWRRLEGQQKVRIVFKNGAVGALIGLFVAALYGVPAGILNCQFMNCSVGMSATFWALISLYWVAAGGFLGALVGLDKLEDDLYSYVEGVRRGEALFVVETSEEKAVEARRILQQEHGTVIHDVPGGAGAK